MRQSSVLSKCLSNPYTALALRDMLQSRPASYISLLNTVCNLSNATIKQEEHKQNVENK